MTVRITMSSTLDQSKSNPQFASAIEVFICVPSAYSKEEIKPVRLNLEQLNALIVRLCYFRTQMSELNREFAAVPGLAE